MKEKSVRGNVKRLMRKDICSGLVRLSVVMAGIAICGALFSDTAYAEIDKTTKEITDDMVAETELMVNIFANGEMLYLQKGNYEFYASGPVMLKCSRPGNYDDEDVASEEYSYVVRNSVNEEYGPEETAEGGSAVISPIGRENSFYVKMYAKLSVICEDIDEDGTKKGTRVNDIIYESGEYHIIFDLNAPVIEELSGIEWDKWVNYERTGTFTVTDSQSGVGRVVVECMGDILYEYHGDISEGMNDDIGENIDRNAITFSAPADREAADSSGVKITITVSDRAGNENQAEYTYFVDKTSPRLDIAGLVNNWIYNCEVAPTIVSVDNIPDNSCLEYRIDRVLRDMQDAISARNISEGAGEKGLSATERLYLDGEYILTAKAYDAAGNESDKSAYNFRIDRTAPIINISGFSNGINSSRALQAGVRVEEDFYSDMSVSVRVTRRWPGGESSYIKDDFVPDYYEQSKNYNLVEDGDYLIAVTAEDAAGNRTVSESSLRIDATAPGLSLDGISNGQITSSVPRINLNIKELFYDSAGASILLTRRRDDGSYECILADNIGIGASDYNRRIEVPGEGDFMLKVIAADETGNSSAADMEFTVDCTPPRIGWLDSIRHKYLKSFVFPKGFAGYISDSTGVSYRAHLNAYRIEEGEGVSNDGKYVLRIVANDEAGNTSEETAEFIVDTSPPRIVVSGLEADGSVKKGEVISFGLFDEGDCFVNAKFDGSDIILTDGNRKCVVDITDSAEHVIELKAVDQAGNETDKTFHISGRSFGGGGEINEEMRVLTKGIAEGNSVNITKKTDEKYVYIFLALFCGICVIGFPILLGLRHIDTKE